MDNQLVKLIDENGLDKTKGQVLLENFSGYFEMAAEWERKANELVITSIEQRDEMKLAREGRLFLKDKRISVEKTRKQLKEASLREGQTIDAIAKVLTNLIIPIEKDLEEKEKFVEIQEAKRIESLRNIRTRELEPYVEFVPYGLDFGIMDEGNYQKVLSGAKLQKKAKEDADRKAERERVAREQKEQRDKKRQNKLFQLGLKWDGQSFTFHDINFHWTDVVAMTDAAFNKAYTGAQKKKEQIENEIKKENERLRKEAEIRERKLAEEREKAEAEKMKLEEKARKEREEYERQLQIEREKQAKIEAERKAEQARIEAERLESERKAAAEKRAMEEAERRAKNAPDKEKIKVFIDKLLNIEYPELKSEEAIKIMVFVPKEIAEITKKLALEIDKL